MRQQPICHLVYRISSKEDIVHRFSPDGYELLSEEFLAYPELTRSVLEKDSLVLMEITGAHLTESERQSVERALRVHYQLQLSEKRDILKKYRLRMIWFLLSFIVSAALLFWVKSDTKEVLVQYAYLPFWFFGYRLLTYPILEYIPICREAVRIGRLSCMKLIFTEDPLREISQELERETAEEARMFAVNTRKNTKNDILIQSYFLEGNVLQLETVTGDPGDLLDGHCVPGRERISPEFSAWLEQALPFLTPRRSVQLTVRSCGTEEARAAITAGLRHYFDLRLADAKQQLAENNHRILVFCAGLLLASLALAFWGSYVGKASHELILIILWFFGDYLIEYILLTDRQLRRELECRRKLKDMSVCFK